MKTRKIYKISVGPKSRNHSRRNKGVPAKPKTKKDGKCYAVVNPS